MKQEAPTDQGQPGSSAQPIAPQAQPDNTGSQPAAPVPDATAAPADGMTDAQPVAAADQAPTLAANESAPTGSDREFIADDL